MRRRRATATACLILLGAAVSGHSEAVFAAETPEVKPPVRASCEEAIVNPVSGHAECVRPAGAPVDPPPERPPVIKLAVFDFELDDVSPAASLLGQTTSSKAAMDRVTQEARRVLAESGRFILVDVGKVDAEPAKSRNCNGCENDIAAQAGAEEALIGVVRRVTQTDYYVQLQISDARTGKILDQQGANFAGGPDGWASGVRMLIKHQVLVSADSP